LLNSPNAVTHFNPLHNLYSTGHSTYGLAELLQAYVIASRQTEDWPREYGSCAYGRNKF